MTFRFHKLDFSRGRSVFSPQSLQTCSSVISAQAIKKGQRSAEEPAEASLCNIWYFVQLLILRDRDTWLFSDTINLTFNSEKSQTVQLETLKFTATLRCLLFLICPMSYGHTHTQTLEMLPTDNLYIWFGVIVNVIVTYILTSDLQGSYV